MVDKQIIETFNDPKLNDVSQVELRQKLAYIFTLIGLGKIPDKIEQAVIEDYIRSTYPFFTIGEFTLAFKLAVQGVLECDIEHYEKFSPKYISQIINAFKKRASQTRKILSEMPKEEPEAVKLSDDEIVAFTQKEWLESARNDFNKVFNADKVFGILLKQGKLKFTPDDMLQIIKMVKEDNLHRMNKLYGADAKEFSKKIKNEDFLDTQCKKLALVQYFENISN